MAKRKRERRTCRIRGCDRPSRALGVCSTHYKHLKQYGQARPIRRRRGGREGTVKFQGFSLSEACVRALREEAARRGLSPNAVITEVVERWVRRRAR
ncbi:MAG TPA: hypothetical protein VK447_14775 [Myxococcaceae bacterium]|nr:hypothetical protein [Myxococcaceae bacterium]